MSVKKGGEKRDDERTQQRADEDALQKARIAAQLTRMNRRMIKRSTTGTSRTRRGAARWSIRRSGTLRLGAASGGAGAGAVRSSLAVKWRPPVDGAAASGGAGEGSG